MKVIDLFCGAGGMSEGLRQAGYEIACGVDIDTEAGMTFQKNFPEATFICKDLRELSTEELLQQANITANDVAIIVGGPPCQGFSMAGKRFIDDPRNVLFKEFVRIVGEVRPIGFIMENVVGLVSMDNGRFKHEILESFKEIGYEASVEIMNAADYGVPQLRRRTIFLGNRINKEIIFPPKTHGDQDQTKLQWVTVKEAIGDLPHLQNTFGSNVFEFSSIAQTAYQRYMRNEISFEEYLQIEYNGGERNGSST